MFNRLRRPKPNELRETRYEIEHRQFPTLLYRDPKIFLGYMMSTEDAAYLMFQKGFEYMKLALPYPKEAFRVRHGLVTEGVHMVSIELPEPEFEPLCYRIHFVTSPELERPEMYTIEKGMQGGFLCGWTRNAHVNYHAIAQPKFEGREKAMMIALEASVISNMYAEQYGLKKSGEGEN